MEFGRFVPSFKRCPCILTERSVSSGRIFFMHDTSGIARCGSQLPRRMRKMRKMQWFGGCVFTVKAFLKTVVPGGLSGRATFN